MRSTSRLATTFPMQELTPGGALLGSHEAITLHRFKASSDQKGSGMGDVSRKL